MGRTVWVGLLGAVGVCPLTQAAMWLGPIFLTKHWNSGADRKSRAVWGVFPGEVGGGNGLEALVVAMQMGLPVVDMDLMGRAFPELQVGAPL